MFLKNSCKIDKILTHLITLLIYSSSIFIDGREVQQVLPTWEWRIPYLWEGSGSAFGTSGTSASWVLRRSAQWSRRIRSAVANCCKSPRKDWTSHCGGNSIYLEGKQLARWTCQSNAGSSFPSVWAEHQSDQGYSLWVLPKAWCKWTTTRSPIPPRAEDPIGPP